MADERNALAELARNLKKFADMNRMADIANGGIITKAQRIIKELAKVQNVEAVNTCRAIAGQKTENGDKKRQSSKHEKTCRDARIAQYRREVVEKSRETIKALSMVMRHESCPILSHSLAEVKHALAWCEKTFAE